MNRNCFILRSKPLFIHYTICSIRFTVTLYDIHKNFQYYIRYTVYDILYTVYDIRYTIYDIRYSVLFLAITIYVTIYVTIVIRTIYARYTHDIPKIWQLIRYDYCSSTFSTLTLSFAELSQEITLFKPCSTCQNIAPE